MDQKKIFLQNLAKEIAKLCQCKNKFNEFERLPLDKTNKEKVYLESATILERYLVKDMEGKYKREPCDVYQKIVKEIHELFLQIAPDEPHILAHDDLDVQNILATPDGKIKAIIDWDKSRMLPLCFIFQHIGSVQAHIYDDDYHEQIELQGAYNKAM